MPTDHSQPGGPQPGSARLQGDTDARRPSSLRAAALTRPAGETRTSRSTPQMHRSTAKRRRAAAGRGLRVVGHGYVRPWTRCCATRRFGCSTRSSWTAAAPVARASGDAHPAGLDLLRQRRRPPAGTADVQPGVHRAPGGRPAAGDRADHRRLLDRLAERRRRRQPVEFMAEFALPLPSDVIGELLGARGRIGPGSRPGSGHSVTCWRWAAGPGGGDRGRPAAVELTAYFADLLAQRRAQPREDIVRRWPRSRTPTRSSSPTPSCWPI